MALKLFLVAAFAYAATAAHIPQPIQVVNNNPSVETIQGQRQQNTLVENRSSNAEKLQRQDEYLRSIDQSSNQFQNDYYQQQSNRLQDNEYRRINYYYAGNQQDRNIYQNQQQDQYQQNRPDAQVLINQFERELYEPLLVAQATNNFPYNYRNFYTPTYTSRVNFNSPLVSYRY